MSCRGTRKRLLEHIEGRLPLKSAEEVSEHLSSCGRCREVARELEEARAILRTVGRSPAPAGFREAVRERMASSQWSVRGIEATRHQGVKGRWWVGWGRPAIVGGAAVIALAVWFGLRWASQPPVEPLATREPAAAGERVAVEGNEMDEFVDFCLEQHSRFVSQRTLSDEGSLAMAQRARVLMRPARIGLKGLGSRVVPREGPLGVRQPLPAMKPQERQWWWAGATSGQ